VASLAPAPDPLRWAGACLPAGKAVRPPTPEGPLGRRVVAGHWRETPLASSDSWP